MVFYIDGDVEGMERSPGSWSPPAAVTPVPLLMQDSLTNYTQGPQVHQRATVSGLKALYDLTPA